MSDLTTLPTLPTAPNSITRPKTFVADADATFGALPGLVTAWNTNVPVFNTNVELVVQKALVATDAQASAEQAQAAAEAASAATKWVSGTTYTQGVVVWSPADFASYRRKTTGAGTVDPSADGTNWAPLGLSASSASTLTNKTLGSGTVFSSDALARIQAAALCF